MAASRLFSTRCALTRLSFAPVQSPVPCSTGLAWIEADILDPPAELDDSTDVAKLDPAIRLTSPKRAINP